MDGNGRWATAQNKPRTYGHKQGLLAMKEIIKSCLELNINCASFYAFSTENWNRPKSEVDYLIKLLENEILNKKLIKWLMDNSVRLIWNGFKNNMNPKLIESIHKIEKMTANNKSMTLQIMFNYGSRQKIIEAFNKIHPSSLVTVDLFSKYINPHNLPDLDLIIRTSGENRISNFMLWELSYSEIIFNKTLWPDYNKKELMHDIDEFNKRKRRYGNI